MKGATIVDPSMRDPPRVKSAVISVEIEGKTLKALFDSGCEVDVLSEAAAVLCGLHIHSLASSLWLKFADGSKATRVGKVMDVTCWVVGAKEKYAMKQDFYVGPIHHDAILGMPWIRAWKARVDTSLGVVKATVPQEGRRVHLLAPPHKRHDVPVSGVETAAGAGDAATSIDDILEPKAMLIGSLKAKGQETVNNASPMSSEQQECWEALREQFKDVLNNKELPAGRPPASRPKHHIQLIPGSAPSYAPRYRRPPCQEQVIEEQADELLAKGKIRESKSAFSHNPVLVKRKDGRWRMCINYKPLNAITVKQRFPMPRVDELLDRLQGACVFSSLDFTDAFLQIEIAEKDKHKTAFHTATRKFEYICMPFGLVNAPAELQRQANNDFAVPIAERWMVVYADDVLIFSRSVAEHLMHLRKALELIKENQWYLKAQKCLFFMSSLNFLGFKVSGEGVQPDAAKVATLAEWPLPMYTVKDVQRFYGMASYYRCFIPGFAQQAAPLTQLFRKDVAFVWSEEHSKAARSLIHHLTSSPILMLPDFSLQFYLTTDASDTAVGAMLSQKLPEDRKHRIIACYSHRFTETEQKYPVREKELYAIWWAVKKCKHYLYGQQFIVQTDHQSLMHLDKTWRDFDKVRVQRWMNYLAGYDYTIVYIQGVTNVVADALSRRPTAPQVQATSVVTSLESRFITKLKQSYDVDSWAAFAVARLQKGKRLRGYCWADNLLWARRKGNKLRLYVPASLRKEVLIEHHDHVLAGHGGTHSTVEKVKRSFWWPKLRAEVEAYVLSCPECQKHKPRNTLKPGLLQPLPIPTKVWSDISMDFVVKLPELRGLDSILVVVDRLSKYAHFIPCHSTIDAKDAANLFIVHIWKLHGVPNSIVSDRDPKFMSTFWQSFMRRLGIRLCPTTANHPEADGQTERTNRTMMQFLRLYASDNPQCWLDFLPCAEFAYNTTVHCSIGCTPASLVYTDSPMRDPQLESAVEAQQPFEAVERFVEKLGDARRCMKKAQEQQALYYNKKRQHIIFETGDLVLVAREALKGSAEGEDPKKLSPKWHGPYRILSRINAAAYVVDLPKIWKNHRTINVGFLQKFRADAEFARTLPKKKRQAAPTKRFEGLEEVRQVREKTQRNRKIREFEVRWAGEKDTQWISEQKLRQTIDENEFQAVLRMAGVEGEEGLAQGEA